MTDKKQAFEILTQLTLEGYTEEQILHVILSDYLSGSDALEAMKYVVDEFEATLD